MGCTAMVCGGPGCIPGGGGGCGCGSWLEDAGDFRFREVRGTGCVTGGGSSRSLRV